MKRPSWQEPLIRRWAALQPRERLGLQAAVGLLVLYLAWTWAVAPALATLANAQAQRQDLERQLQRMQALSAQASAIQNEARPTPKDWRRELKDSLPALGQAQLVESAGTVQVQLKACEAQALGRWLAELAPRWRLQVSQAQLRADDQGLWQGQIILVAP